MPDLLTSLSHLNIDVISVEEDSDDITVEYELMFSGGDREPNIFGRLIEQGYEWVSYTVDFNRKYIVKLHRAI